MSLIEAFAQNGDGFLAGRNMGPNFLIRNAPYIFPRLPLATHENSSDFSSAS
jgi:hypothetical protein